MLRGLRPVKAWRADNLDAETVELDGEEFPVGLWLAHRRVWPPDLPWVRDPLVAMGIRFLTRASRAPVISRS